VIQQFFFASSTHVTFGAQRGLSEKCFYVHAYITFSNYKSGL